MQLLHQVKFNPSHEFALHVKKFKVCVFLFYFSKLQKTKRDIRGLQGVTGEWFEEIQRKKFCNETDVSQMLKQPLTHRLRKGMAENGETLWLFIVDKGSVDLQFNQSVFRTIFKS